MDDQAVKPTMSCRNQAREKIILQPINMSSHRKQDGDGRKHLGKHCAAAARQAVI